MQTVHLNITGFVQGVGFRQFIKQQAQGLHITGWVKNLPDGSVETICTGEKDDLMQLIDRCKKGTFLSEIENIQILWEKTYKEFTSFDILK